MSDAYQQEALSILRRAGEQQDHELNLAEIALAFGAMDKPSVHLEPYRDHLRALLAQAQCSSDVPLLHDRIALLHRVLVHQNRYYGESQLATDFAGDDVREVNLLDVIERRRGAAIAIGILYLYVGLSLGWSTIAIDYAGRFFIRLAAQDGHAILDPSRGGKVCSADELAALHAEEASNEKNPQGDAPALALSADYISTLSKREILLRLQNNVKRRLLAQDKLDAAISVLQGMILIAPRNQQLWRELSYLQSERGSLRAAITALEVVCDLAEEEPEAKAKLKELRWRLN